MEYKKSAVLGYDKHVARLCIEALLEVGYDRAEWSADLSVAELGKHDPKVLIIDSDHMRSDKLESIRQVRFVLPDCLIAVVSSDLSRAWARKCHMAGSNGVFPSGQSASRTAAGLRRADVTGCFTDPAFTPPEIGPNGR